MTRDDEPLALSNKARRMLIALCRYTLTHGTTSEDAKKVADILLHLSGDELPAGHGRIRSAVDLQDSLDRAFGPGGH